MDHLRLNIVADFAAALHEADDWSATVDAFVPAFGAAFGFRRVSLFEIHEIAGAGLGQTCTHDWHVDGFASMLTTTPYRVQDVTRPDLPLRQWAEQRRRGEIVMGLTRDFSGYMRDYYDHFGVVNFCTVPLMVNRRWWGTLCIDSGDAERPWGGGEVALMRLVATLISEAVERSNASFMASEASRIAMLRSSPDGVVTIDEAGAILEFNPAAETMFGLARASVIGRPLGDVIVPEHLRGAHRAGFARYLAGGESHILGRAIETEAQRADGTTLPVELTVTEVKAEGRRLFTAYLTDISERLAAKQQLEALAFFDASTGLPNRTWIVSQAGLREAATGVVVLRLPYFDVLSASLGFAFADLMLRAAAERLKEALGDRGSLARTGDAEFAAVVLLPHSPAVCAEVLRAAMAEAFVLDGRRFYLRCAIGYVGEGSSIEAMLTDARMAASGDRSGVAGYDAAVRTSHQERLALETDLHDAILRRSPEIHVVYQPIVSMATRRIVGYEALARWNHPVRGGVPPSIFVPVAEASGLAGPLGELVADTAARDAVAWNRTRRRGEPPVYVSINLSARQFSDPGLVPTLADTLRAAGTPPSFVCFELTESALMERTEDAVETLTRLRELGARTMIDDFGIGYSSFGYLQHFPIDGLKIDRSFVAAMAESERSREIVRVMADLAHGLGLSVVGEGVENAETYALLHAAGCDLAQGYLLGRPAGLASVMALQKAGGEIDARTCWPAGAPAAVLDGRR